MKRYVLAVIVAALASVLAANLPTASGALTFIAQNNALGRPISPFSGSQSQIASTTIRISGTLTSGNGVCWISANPPTIGDCGGGVLLAK